MAATRIKSQDIKDADVVAADIAATAVTYAKLLLAANPGLEDGGAGATQVKVAAPVTLGAGGIGVSDFTADAGAGGVRGTVIAPTAGSAAAGKFLKAAATWDIPLAMAEAGTAGAEQIANGTFAAKDRKSVV